MGENADVVVTNARNRIWAGLSEGVRESLLQVSRGLTRN